MTGISRTSLSATLNSARHSVHNKPPLPLGSLSRGGLSLIGGKDAPLEFSLSAPAERIKSSSVGVHRRRTQRSDVLAVIGDRQGQDDSYQRSKSKEESGVSSPTAQRKTSCPPRISEMERRRRSKETKTESCPVLRALSQDTRESEEEEPMTLTEAIQQLSRPRAIWDAELWLELRAQCVDAGKHEDVRNLMSIAHKSTRKALEGSSYVSETGARVNLRAHLKANQVAQWFGRATVDVHDLPTEAEGLETDIGAPIIVADFEPLEVVRRLRTNANFSRQINVLTEITDFDRHTGEISRQCSAAGSQQSCLVQTDFSCFLDPASRAMKKGQSTVEQHLRAPHDSYVCLCPGVTMFRGQREDGYPLLDELVSMNVIFSSLPEARPMVSVGGDGSEWYADEKDQTAVLERLNLIGLVALQRNATDSESLPVLVLSALGCTGRGRHPRDAIANSLKHWRLRYGKHFHCIVVACGADKDLASLVDRVVNEQVYGMMKQGGSSFEQVVRQSMAMELGKWHWDPDFLALHVKALEMQSIGRYAKDSRSSLMAKQEQQEQEEKRRFSINTSLKVPEKARSFKVDSLEFKCDVATAESLDVGASLTTKDMESDNTVTPRNTTARMSMKENIFMGDALREMQIARSRAGSRCGTPTGSRSGSKERMSTMEDHGTSSEFLRVRQNSLIPGLPTQRPQSRQNSIYGGEEVDLLDDPLSSLNPRSNSIYGGLDPRRDSVGVDVIASPRSGHRNSSFLVLPGAQLPGSRSGSIVDILPGPRKGSMAPSLPSSRQGSLSRNSLETEDIISNNFQSFDGSPQKGAAARQSMSNGRNSKPLNGALQTEELRRQARERLRSRKSDAAPTAMPGVQEEVKEIDAKTASGDSLSEKDESTLVQELQKLAGTVQQRLDGRMENKRESRRKSSKEAATAVYSDPLLPQVVENSDGNKKVSLLIPEVPVGSGPSSAIAGKPDPRRSSIRRVMADVSSFNMA